MDDDGKRSPLRPSRLRAGSWMTLVAALGLFAPAVARAEEPDVDTRPRPRLRIVETDRTSAERPSAAAPAAAAKPSPTRVRFGAPDRPPEGGAPPGGIGTDGEDHNEIGKNAIGENATADDGYDVDGSLLQAELDEAFGHVRDVQIGDLPAHISLIGDFRWRGEYHDPFDVAAGGDRSHDTLHLFRFRLGLDLKISEYLEVLAEYQVSEVTDDPRSPDPSSSQDSADFQRLWAEITPMGREGDRVALRVGRQNLDYGQQRLIGSFQFSNVARTFDAFRARGWWGDFTLDGVLGYVVEHEDDHANDAIDDIALGLVQLQWRPTEKRVIEVYEILKFDQRRDQFLGDDGRRDDAEIFTTGARAEGPLLWGFDASLEGALQWGRIARDEVRAWAYHIRLGWETKELPVRVRLFLELNMASGDEEPGDGNAERFDNLFPTNHAHYGLMDLFSWRNLEDYVAGIRIWPLPRVVIGVDFHHFRLQERKDGWFNAGGRLLRRDPTGASGKSIAWELDVLVRWKVNAYLTFEAVYGRLRPLGFAQATDPKGGSADDIHLGYLQVQLKF